MKNYFLAFTFLLFIVINFSVYSKNIDAETRFEIIDVMNKYAITKYINREINNAANYERTQFSTYLKA